jgi:hypothetical protein
LADESADTGPVRTRRRQRREPSVPGYASGADAPLRATADALERARNARSVVLVEGISDQIAVETLASLQARDLAKEGVAVVPIGGAQSVVKFLAHFGPAGIGLRVSGLCDAAEARHFCRALARSGSAQPETRSDLEREGFFVCDRDLEDELIRAVGPDAIEAILAEERDLAAFRTLQKQAAWRDADFVDQFRRFLGAGARRKLRYAGLFVRALDLDRQPRPLRDVLSRAWLYG